jgi:lysophospholipase L1-like esterase
MSDRKLTKQADLNRLDPLLSPHRKPILLTDSKGFNLQSEVRINPETFIEFWARASLTVADGLQYLKDNLQKHINLLHPQTVTLFIWLGTCDLTYKPKHERFIYLKSKKNTTVNSVCRTLKEIHNFTKQFGSKVKVIFLHLPIYSIYHWNFHKQFGSGVWKFKNDDRLLRQQIEVVNNYINDLNRILHVHSPQFSIDLKNSHRRYLPTHSYTEYGYRFNCYKDGVHPKPLLAKLWLIRITRLLHDYCY